MNKRGVGILVFIIIVITAVFILIKDQSPSPGPSSNKLQVVASFYPLYFFAQEIGGEKVEVHNITPAGAEPHDYEPTPQDLFKIANSDIIILNGNGLEVWADNLGANINPDKTSIIVVAEGLALPKLTNEDDGAVLDPHIWLNPQLAKLIADKIADAFENIDGVNAD